MNTLMTIIAFTDPIKIYIYIYYYLEFCFNFLKCNVVVVFFIYIAYFHCRDL